MGSRIGKSIRLTGTPADQDAMLVSHSRVARADEDVPVISVRLDPTSLPLSRNRV
jgi:hypothetical protein